MLKGGNFNEDYAGFFVLFSLHFNLASFHFDSENVTRNIHNTSLLLPFSLYPLTLLFLFFFFFFALRLLCLRVLFS